MSTKNLRDLVKFASTEHGSKILKKAASLDAKFAPFIKFVMKKAFEFPNDEALKKYLHEHPGADRSLHKVVKHETPKTQGINTKSNPSDVANHLLYKGLMNNPTIKQVQGVLRQTNTLRSPLDQNHIVSIHNAISKNPDLMDHEGSASEFKNKVTKAVAGDEQLSKIVKPLDGKQLGRLFHTVHESWDDVRPDYLKFPKTKYKKTKSLLDDLGHSLRVSDVEEVEAWVKDKPAFGKKITDAEKLRRFLEKASPETRDRMKGVTPAEFGKMIGAIMEDDEAAS